MFNIFKMREDVGRRDETVTEERGIDLNAIENGSLESLKARNRAMLEELQESKRALDKGISDGSVKFK